MALESVMQESVIGAKQRPFAEYHTMEHIPHTLHSQLSYYKQELDDVMAKRPPETVTRDGVVVLGGFFPARENVEGIKQLARQVGHDPETEIRYLDISDAPAQVLTEEEHKSFVRADLREIDVALNEEKIDLIVLDHVLQLVDDEGFEKVMRGLAQTLTKDGLAVMTFVNPFFTPLEKLTRNAAMKTQTYPRRKGKREQMIRRHLKIVAASDYKFEAFKTATIYTVARKESQHQDFDGKYGGYF